MHIRNLRWLGAAALCGGVLLTIMIIGWAAGASAAPPQQSPAQGADLPTPTPFPVAEPVYTLDEINLPPQTLRFELEAQDEMAGITLGETTVSSHYPRGMVFTLRPTSANGAIESVNLHLTYVSGLGTRAAAEWDADQGAWVVHMWATGNGHPAWVHVDMVWRVRDDAGVEVESVPVGVDYADHTRRWFRLDTPYMLIYWFGLGDDDPHNFARQMAWALESTHQRRVDGFGAAISYRPIGVIYATHDEMGEMYGSGVVNRGGAFSEMGMSVLPVTGGQTLQQIIDWMTFTSVHELVHLYQSDLLGASRGPEWWYEGQANWFSANPTLADARLRHLATLQDLPTFTRPINKETLMADGRPNLGYDMGQSFINFLNANHGGMATHAQIVAGLQSGVSLIPALEQATGVSFFDLENEWRAYIGLEPFTLADIDPASALQPYEDSALAVGDSVTLPANPPLAPIYEAPGPRVLTSGQCFANMQVTILRMGTLDGVPYFQVDCLGQVGWMSRDQLVGPGS